MTFTPNYERVLAEAHAAAEAAVLAKGPENSYALDCGFAWVTLGGNEPFARWCRKQLDKQIEANPGARAYDFKRVYGSKGYPKGWQWWKPGNFNGQAIGHHRAGAEAFCEVLARHNISATVGSRYD